MDGNDAIRRVMDGSVWDEFCERLKRAGRLVIGAAPEDAFERAEGLRYVGRIARHALQNFIEESDPAAPVVTTGLPKLGGDNPDYVYAKAPLSGRFEYRLRGSRGDASYLGIGTYYGEIGTPEGLQCSGYIAGGNLETDAEGAFEILLSCAEKPGNWLPMRPETSQLMIRQLLLDRRNQQPASFHIERVDAGGTSGPLDPARYAALIGRAGAYVEGAIAQFLQWSQTFASRPNQIRVLDEHLAAGARGDPRTHYYAGYYALARDEALLIQLEPPRCEYWNLQLCNHWLESLDYWQHTIHVNHHTAIARADGSVRLVVAHRDPRVPNWLDTAGHSRGCIILRWVGTTEPYDPVCRVVRHTEIPRE
ncbi:MAG: hypothetical protein H6Q33_3392 [Deltaproteobacteria bacterium]|jgi:hypothetical protein|nr:hypothetical protein [Deltaproteobacteria bacterium]